MTKIPTTQRRKDRLKSRLQAVPVQIVKPNQEQFVQKNVRQFIQKKLYTLSLHYSIAQLFNSIKLKTVFVLSHVFMKNKYCVLIIQYFSFSIIISIGGSEGGARDAPPGVQILSFSCSFWQKIYKIIPIWELAHPLGKILDPPLISMRNDKNTFHSLWAEEFFFINNVFKWGPARGIQ